MWYQESICPLRVKFLCFVCISSKVDCTKEPGVEWEPLIAGDGSTWQSISTVRQQATGIWQPTVIVLPHGKWVSSQLGSFHVQKHRLRLRAPPSPTSHSQDILPAACSYNFRFSSFICARASPKSVLYTFFYECFEGRGKGFRRHCSCLKARSAQKSGVIGEFLISIALVDAI